MPALRIAWVSLGVAAISQLSAPPAAAQNIEAQLKATVAATCTDSGGNGATIGNALGGAIRLDIEPMKFRGREVGTRTRYELTDGARILVERFTPGGNLRRVIIVYHAPAERAHRPEWMVFADDKCRIVSARRLIYDGPGAPAFIERTDASLTRVDVREPLNPPVPEGGTRDGVLVALVDSGVNYLLDAVRRRMARGADGGLLGFDYWDMDSRPFDSNPATSPFLPQRHGTQTAGVLIAEAPSSRLVVYRYPRLDMRRMAALVEDAAATGVVIVNLSLGSTSAEEWAAFAEAARKHPDMLFIASAGNDGRDIDAQPVFPAALRLENLLTATSSTETGVLAAGSNWGAESVDLLVPAESLVSIDFYGRPKLVSGSSYAAARLSALAACLLAAHPEWKGPQLKAAILDRVRPPPNGAAGLISRGMLESPTETDRGACEAEPKGVEVIARSRIGVKALYGDSKMPDGVRAALEASLVMLQGTRWSTALLESAARDAAGIFAQCGVMFRGFEVFELRTPRRYLYFNDAHAAALVRGLDIPRPAVFFVRDTLQRIAFDAEAIGRSSGRRRPELVDTVWMTEATSHPGIALAHELYHVLADSGAHSDDAANLMYSRTSGDNKQLDEAQCMRLRKVSASDGHLTPAK
ncbi:MAG: S8 family serine peptidase [Betaproteobacteria bacterium]|nr:S8 family serine peptidase [Betaproteobacteria bacterium]MDH3435908.1 S8 family serine peptidase [Betaproteobacteria bacterium]